jgi:hypothetical protein
VAQVNTAMEHVNATTQQNASASEELSATAEELSAQAAQLQELMGFFRVDEQARASAQQASSIGDVRSRRPAAAAVQRQPAGHAALRRSAPRNGAAREPSLPVMSRPVATAGGIDESQFTRF